MVIKGLTLWRPWLGKFENIYLTRTSKERRPFVIQPRWTMSNPSYKRRDKYVLIPYEKASKGGDSKIYIGGLT